MNRYPPKAGSRSERYAYKQKQLNRRYKSSYKPSRRKSGSKNTSCLGCAGCMIPTVFVIVAFLAGIIFLIALLI